MGHQNLRPSLRLQRRKTFPILDAEIQVARKAEHPLSNSGSSRQKRAEDGVQRTSLHEVHPQRNARDLDKTELQGGLSFGLQAEFADAVSSAARPAHHDRVIGNVWRAYHYHLLLLLFIMEQEDFDLDT